MFVFSIYDSKADAFLTPMFFRNRGVALRSFMSAVQDEGSDFHRYASDYTLFEIGTWDDDKGVFCLFEAKVNLGLAVQFLDVPLKEVS